MFESADVLRRQQTQRLRDEALGLHDRTHDSVLEYPPRVPPEALQVKISRYPAGVTTLALNSRLSIQFLSFFDIFYDWFTAATTTPGPHESMTELGHDILGAKGLSFTERLLAVAVQAYINWVERARRKWTNFSSEHAVEVQIGVLKKSGRPGTDAQADDTRDAFLWSCLMIRDTTVLESGARAWADEQLRELGVDAKGDLELQAKLDGLFFARPGSKHAEYAEGFLMHETPLG
ncbi:hypothetical protein A1O7_08957 [Cladophialophora yegresii CBS 114405]|uniref:Transcription factor domain-containing protein n=1 Tax=Cladophialophora yegresii CBS 114405 TaxID=1182544 RepID=W9VV41_9EURO|nr:uncharacterized protein A1O7_08957 [Cladophialophora yegresii CBS 114405]EXJ56026.1 hypothetical protein A1O7_08957 [Cladophialophora yegresii CBS 114405]